MTRRHFLGLVTACMLCFSCGPSILYSDQWEIPRSGWTYGQVAPFDFEITDTTTKYDLILDIEHADSYPFENVYLHIRTVFPEGRQAFDTLGIDLSDGAGRWIGRCSGAQCKLRISLQRSVRFKPSGSYQISFEQFSRDSTLQGIQQIGFAVWGSEE